MPDLEFAEKADAHHLDSGKYEDAGDDEDGTVKRHDVLAGCDFEDQEPGGHAGSGHHAKSAEGAEEVQRPRHITEQEADGQQIEEDAEGAGDAVVGLPCRTGGIGDGYLADAGAVPGGECRNEAMHLAVKRDVLDDLAAIGLEGGAEVVDVDAAENRHEPVRGAGGDAAHEHVVGSLRAPAADDVVALFELG